MEAATVSPPDEKARMEANQRVVEEADALVQEARDETDRAKRRERTAKEKREDAEFKLHDLIGAVQKFGDDLAEAPDPSKLRAAYEKRVLFRAAEIDNALRKGK